MGEIKQKRYEFYIYMDSLDPLNSVAGGGTSFDTVRLIMLMIGTFFFGELTAAIN